jgi:hypothetical protein
MRSVHGSSSVRGAARETAVAPLICRKGTFVCAEKSVALGIAWHRRIGAGFFGGQGFILQKVRVADCVFDRRGPSTSPPRHGRMTIFLNLAGIDTVVNCAGMRGFTSKSVIPTLGSAALLR